MTDDMSTSVALLLLDKKRIENVIANDITGRVVKVLPTNVQISLYNWKMGKGETGILYDKEPSVIYIIKKETLSEDQLSKLTEISQIKPD